MNYPAARYGVSEGQGYCTVTKQASGNRTLQGIELEEPLPFTDGTRLEVTVTPVPKPRKGSPQAMLQLAGTLTPAEAGAMLQAAQACRRIDWDLWEQ